MSTFKLIKITESHHKKPTLYLHINIVVNDIPQAYIS